VPYVTYQKCGFLNSDQWMRNKHTSTKQQCEDAVGCGMQIIEVCAFYVACFISRDAYLWYIESCCRGPIRSTDVILYVFQNIGECFKENRLHPILTY
jgi:hypothetical protein